MKSFGRKKPDTQISVRSTKKKKAATPPPDVLAILGVPVFRTGQEQGPADFFENFGSTARNRVFPILISSSLANVDTQDFLRGFLEPTKNLLHSKKGGLSLA